MTIEQRPSANDVHGAFEPLYFVLSSTEQQSASNYKFRYIADLYVNAVKVSSVKIYPNNEGEGVFRVERLIQDWMSSTRADQNVTTNGYLAAKRTEAFSLSSDKSTQPPPTKIRHNI
jgi:hypothetical protein